MNTSSDRTLRTNPFHTYRDPQTGLWITVVPKPLMESEWPTKLQARSPQIVEVEDFYRLQNQLA